MLELKGAEGEIRWVYTTAAVVGPFRLEADRAGGTLTADIVSVDDYKITREPLTFVVRKAGKPWIWPVSNIRIVGTSLTATLGAVPASASKTSHVA